MHLDTVFGGTGNENVRKDYETDVTSIVSDFLRMDVPERRDHIKSYSIR
jgi:hypothetical protein